MGTEFKVKAYLCAPAAAVKETVVSSRFMNGGVT